MSDHPFSTDQVASVAKDHDVSPDHLDRNLAAVQQELMREDGGYEYSTKHTFGWEDETAYYFFGSSDAWQTISDELVVNQQMGEALREVHYHAMMDAASSKGDQETVREMLDDDTEPIVVSDLDYEHPQSNLGV